MMPARMFGMFLAISMPVSASAGLIPGTGPTPAEQLADQVASVRAALPVEIEPGVEMIDAYNDGLNSFRVIEVTRAGSGAIANRIYQATANQRCGDPLARRLFDAGGRAVAILIDDLGEQLQTVVVDQSDCIR